MRKPDLQDSRQKQGIYSQVGLLGSASDGAIALLAGPAPAQQAAAQRWSLGLAPPM